MVYRMSVTAAQQEMDAPELKAHFDESMTTDEKPETEATFSVEACARLHRHRLRITITTDSF